MTIQQALDYLNSHVDTLANMALVNGNPGAQYVLQLLVCYYSNPAKYEAQVIALARTFEEKKVLTHA